MDCSDVRGHRDPRGRVVQQRRMRRGRQRTDQRNGDRSSPLRTAAVPGHRVAPGPRHPRRRRLRLEHLLRGRRHPERVDTTAAILSSTNQGATWTQQVSHAPQALSSVACVDATRLLRRRRHRHRHGDQQRREHLVPGGQPDQRSDDGSERRPDGNHCHRRRCMLPAACFMARRSSGNIMMTPLLSVTVNASGTYGSTPDLTDLRRARRSISYSPSVRSIERHRGSHMLDDRDIVPRASARTR